MDLPVNTRILFTYGKKRPRAEVEGGSAQPASSAPQPAAKRLDSAVDGDAAALGGSAAESSFIRCPGVDADAVLHAVEAARPAAVGGSSGCGAAARCLSGCPYISPLQAVADDVEALAYNSQVRDAPAGLVGASSALTTAEKDERAQTTSTPGAPTRSLVQTPQATPALHNRPGARVGLITSFFTSSSGLLSAVASRVGGTVGAGATGGGHGKRGGAGHVLPPPGYSTASPAPTQELCREGEGGSERTFDSFPAGDGRGEDAAVKPGRESGVLVQMHLDMGQRAFGGTVCVSCGMLYTIGLAEDERAHDAFCGGAAGVRKQGRQAGSAVLLAFPGWKHETVVGEAGPGPSGVRARLLHVTHADATSHPSHRCKVEEVDVLLAGQLGQESAPGRRKAVQLHPSSSSASTREGGSSVDPAAHGAPRPECVHRFLAVANGGLVGAVVVELLHPPWAKRVKVAGGGGSGGGEGHADEGRVHDAGGELLPAPFPRPLVLTVGRDAQRERATLGVAQVWVHPSWRRNGVSAALLDAARAHSVYAYPVPLAELAFSQPTRDGYALAAGYTGRPDFLVY